MHSQLETTQRPHRPGHVAALDPWPVAYYTMTVIAGEFYALALAFHLLWVGLITLRTGRPLHALELGSVATRPPWLPTSALLFVLERQRALTIGLPVMLFLGWCAHDVFAVRAAVALWFSLYHLCESSITSRHGEFPLMQSTWAVLLPHRAAAACTTGVVINFILCAGVAKVRIGGLGWLHPRTMKVYFDLYGTSKSRPPLSRQLNRWLAQRSWVTSAISVATVVLECILIPLIAFGMPPRHHWMGAAALIAMHVGIGVAMSLEVGVVFLTTLPSYLVGFGLWGSHWEAANATSLLAMWPWWLLTATIGLAPTACSCLQGSLLPEARPSTSRAPPEHLPSNPHPISSPSPATISSPKSDPDPCPKP